MTISNGSPATALDVLNIYQHGGNVLMGKSGTIYVPVYINNVTGDTNVKLALWGRTAGESATEMGHGVSGHNHGVLQVKTNTSSYGELQAYNSTANPWETPASDKKLKIINGDNTGQTNIGRDGYSTSLPYTAVPSGVEIWIDGSDYSASIGNPNSKSNYHYDRTVSIGVEYTSLSTTPDSVVRRDTVSTYVKTCSISMYTSAGSHVYGAIKFTYDDASTFTTATATKTGMGYEEYPFTNPSPSKLVTEIEWRGWADVTSSEHYIVNNYVEDLYAWGDDGTTEWDSGWLDLTSTITWTAGWHYIELKETGDTGGILIYQVGINTGTD